MTEGHESKTERQRERDLVIAYLSYALEDVRALSDVGTRLLQMTIESLSDDGQTRSH
jgi:hypothetical protein